MSPERIFIIVKWGVLLLLAGFLALITSAYLVSFWGVWLFGKSYNATVWQLMTITFGVLMILPITYLVPYKGTLEYLRKVPKKYQKHIGIIVGVSVVATASIAASILGYLLNGTVSFSLGAVPVIFSGLAGYQAQKEVAGRKKR